MIGSWKLLVETMDLAALGLMLSWAAGVPAQSPDADARAAEVLNQARAALGGSAALEAIHSFSASGDFRVGSGDGQISGTVKLDLLTPDKLMRTMKWSPVQAENVTTVEAMDGDQTWTDSQMHQPGQMMGMGPSGGGLGRGGRRSRGGMGGGEGGAGRSGLGPGLMDGLDSQPMRSYFSCLAMALLLRMPDSPSHTVTSDGKVDINGVKADSVKITTGDGSAVSLAIDEQTHRPVMVGYQEAPDRPEIGQAGHPTVRKNKPSVADGTQEAQQPQKPQLTNVEIYFSEYKAVQEKKFGNVWLPYQITRTKGGQTVEDMHMKEFQLNPHLNPKQFEQKR